MCIGTNWRHGYASTSTNCNQIGTTTTDRDLLILTMTTNQYELQSINSTFKFTTIVSGKTLQVAFYVSFMSSVYGKGFVKIVQEKQIEKVQRMSAHKTK